MLVGAVNRNLRQGLDLERKGPKATSVEELLHFYGMQLLFENSYGNEFTHIRDHYHYIKATYGKPKKLGMRRWEILKRAMNPSVEELKLLCDILHSNFCKQVSQVSVITIDESVIGYQPSPVVKAKAANSLEPIPVVWIPRKPHPNGLENFLAVTMVEHPAKVNGGLPYILDIIPHLRPNDIAPADAVRQVMQRWPHDKSVHIIGTVT